MIFSNQNIRILFKLKNIVIFDCLKNIKVNNKILLIGRYKLITTSSFNVQLINYIQTYFPELLPKILIKEKPFFIVEYIFGEEVTLKKIIEKKDYRVKIIEYLKKLPKNIRIKIEPLNFIINKKGIYHIDFDNFFYGTQDFVIIDHNFYDDNMSKYGIKKGLKYDIKYSLISKRLLKRKGN